LSCVEEQSADQRLAKAKATGKPTGSPNARHTFGDGAGREHALTDQPGHVSGPDANWLKEWISPSAPNQAWLESRLELSVEKAFIRVRSVVDGTRAQQ